MSLSPLCDFDQGDGALCGHLVSQCRWLASASHAGVEMQLGKARSAVIFYHCLSPLHRLVCGQMLPRIGAKMIAAENDPGGVKTDARRDTFHEIAEIGGRHAGVAALLVDLIAGRLDENSLARAKRQRQGGFDDEGMGGANRSDARPTAGQPLAHEWRDGSSHDGGFVD